MNNEILIQLLQIQFKHNRKIDEFRGKINLDYFAIDLLSLVLDAVGVPADNTVEQIGKYGYSEWWKQTDTYSRYWHYEAFKSQVTQGSYEECKAYLEAITLTRQAGYSFDLSLLERALTAS